MQLAEAEQRFQDYVDRFVQSSQADQANIDLKKEHTLRVLAEVRRIMASLKLTPEEARRIELAALFHDIGRFPQFARYGTFQDRKSVNHGLLGYKELRTSALLQGVAWEEARRILQTVLMHNRLQVVPGLPPELDTMLRVVRDADKLDVIAVLIREFASNAGGNSVVTLGLPDKPDRLSRSALEQIRSRGMVRYEQMHQVNDFKLLLLSWIYDLNYPRTREIYLERDYVWKIMQTLPRTEEVEGLEQQLIQDLSAF